MNLNPKPMEKMILGLKTIEMRLYDEKRQKIKKGDIIVFTSTKNKNNKISVKVKNLYTYDSFSKLYENFNKVSLGYNKNEIANPLDMEQYYSREDIIKYGVIGIEVEVLSKKYL